MDELYDELRHHPREPAAALMREAKRPWDRDRVARFGAGRAVLGSVSRPLLHEADLPMVVLTRRATEPEVRRNSAGAPDAHVRVVGYDGSVTARAALQ